MVEINKTHLWVSSLALAAIAESDTGGEIKTVVFGAADRTFSIFSRRKGTWCSLPVMEILCILSPEPEMQEAGRGTLWIRPLKAGWHPGFVDSATDLLCRC